MVIFIKKRFQNNSCKTEKVNPKIKLVENMKNQLEMFIVVSGSKEMNK